MTFDSNLQIFVKDLEIIYTTRLFITNLLCIFYKSKF